MDEISVMKTMSDEERDAYRWALTAPYQSVAARRARTLAKFICRQAESKDIDIRMNVICPHCKTEQQVHAEYVGKRIPCEHCARDFLV